MNEKLEQIWLDIERESGIPTVFGEDGFNAFISGEGLACMHNDDCFLKYRADPADDMELYSYNFDSEKWEQYS